MTISSSAIATPIVKPNQLFALIDIQTGCLTEHGLQLLSQYYNFIVGMSRLIPCNASGTNTVTLTPLDASPLIKQYAAFDTFQFTAAANSTGLVTIRVAARDGNLSSLKAYVSGGSAQANSGDVVSGLLYFATYNDALDSGNGGFVLK